MAIKSWKNEKGQEKFLTFCGKKIIPSTLTMRINLF
jgi:hypothetical protein